MRRGRRVIALALAVAALALTVGACGGEDEETTSNPPASEAPSESAPPPGAGALPPELVECFAERGFELDSPSEIHSAPPRVVNACFRALHGGGGP